MTVIAAAQGGRTAESPYAWIRLAASVALSTIGGVGMWSVVVVLPAVQAEFGTARAGASLPYTLAMIGFVFGGVITGRFADRFGIVPPVLSGTIALGLGYAAASFAQSLWQFALVHGVLIGLLGSSATFGPIVAVISHWVTKRRGIAAGLSATGSYLAGTVWPPIVQHFVATVGWRQTYLGVALFCVAT